jgi:hypothetical protein
MLHGIRAKPDTERARLPLNVDLEGSSNRLEYFELFCTPEIAE